ncbi:anthranilate phosphoribosyltransferase [Sporosarcina sp. Te-1]|uniref:anthranilate phosphoribosyltransferase n=1 Tax=Sporosarcina sp. Te-1 TaxID=2818390 RepID=UPI001A9E0F3C|nr:anthranilate phosphoribosyltransferase [Sporosarcina sp. Te-1]QTD40013.1 anthranilate phosphoribosyltransferase [Sporosarcina sp. Te-1]
MKRFTRKVKAGRHLLYEEMVEAAQDMFTVDADQDEMAAFLIALAKKGETASEVAALASVMSSHASALQVREDLYLDNCGTGGDGANSFNISTAAAFVLAGAGVKVAKHGNRKVSSQSGSHDVLDALGVHSRFELSDMGKLLENEGISFFFAPTVHPKMKQIGDVRRRIGKPTIFNLVGPLTNPVHIQLQFTGINRPDFVMEYASVLRMLGRERAIVVSGPGGLDEASLSGQNSFVLLDKGDLIPFTLTAEDVGLSYAPPSAIRGGSPDENVQMIRSILKGERGPRFDTVVLNAGIGIFANGTVPTIKAGIDLALDSIFSGRAQQKLEAVIAFSEQIRREVAAP